MKQINIFLLYLITFSFSLTLAASTATNQHLLKWKNWDASAFAAAKQENKFILLDLEAVWCHWCHVMDQETYSNPAVVQYLTENFITIKVDQDSRPDLALKYKDYGWPATIFFDSNGIEIVKRAGYIAPNSMLSLLKAIVKDPSPENISNVLRNEKPSNNTALPEAIRVQLLTNHQQSLDQEVGGLVTFQKFIDIDTMEYTLTNILRGETANKDWAIITLNNALKLQDPVWGGFYQYSTDGDWEHPHFEKIVKFQARYIKIYAFAYSIFRDKRYLKAAENTANYVKKYLTDDNGGFYVSQDADYIPGKHSDEYFKLDDLKRKNLGTPRVDKNIYSRENGWLIEALSYLYEVTENPQYLNQAIQSLNTIEKGYLNNEGGFSHQALTAQSHSRFYQSDNTAMGKAYLQLYRATAERRYLKASLKVADFIHNNFYNSNGSYDLAAADGTPISYDPQIGESIALARYFSALFHISGVIDHFKNAKHVMKFLSREKVALASIIESGILLVDNEMNNLPFHITIIGSKQSAIAKQLFTAGLAVPSLVKRIEWWDRKDGKLMNEDVKYPYLTKPAAFVCTNSICSLPLRTPEKLTQFSNKRLDKTQR